MGCDFPSRAVQPRPQQVFGDDLPDSQDGEQPGPSRRKRQPSMSETMPLYTLCKEDLESMDKEVSPHCPLSARRGPVGRDWSALGSAGGSFLAPPGEPGAPPVDHGQPLGGDCRLLQFGCFGCGRVVLFGAVSAVSQHGSLALPPFMDILTFHGRNGGFSSTEEGVFRGKAL